MKFKSKSYKHYLILLSIIILLFIVLNLVYNDKTIFIDVFGKRLKSNNEILLKNENEYYLSFEFVKENIDEEIYFDNVSKKIVISTENSLLKAKINDKKVTKNFDEESVNSIAVIEKNNIYVSLEVLNLAYNIETNLCNNTIYIYENKNFDCKLKTNNIAVYLEGDAKSKIIDYIDKKDKLQGIYENDKFVFAKINDKDVGYILKNMLDYSIDTAELEEKSNGKVYIFADNSSNTLSNNLEVDGVFLNMFDVTKLSANVNEVSFNNTFINQLKQKKIEIYGIVTNGYNLAGFNTSTISQILSDESKRLILINNLEEKVKQYSLDGIVIDFRMIKETDINNYIQFIKEFKAISNKDVIVNIDANEYKNYISLINYSDFSILNVYGLRNTNSTVSGSVSEMNWMQNVIKEAMNIASAEKLIIGIPSYTILWTEKNSNVVSAEIYNLKTTEQYITKNKLEKKYSEVVKQNYVELKKGSLVYKMWVEDEVSIKNRVRIIQDNNINKLAIYKLGYENNDIINIANSIK